MDSISKDVIRFCVDGTDVVNFSSFNYLALTGNEAILKAGQDALGEHTALGRIPPYFIGKQRYCVDAERNAKAYFACDETRDVMFIAVGYLFGLIAVQGLAADFDVAFIDRHAHYNLYDGIKSVGKPYYVYDHLDPRALGRLLEDKLEDGQVPLIITDGVFPVTQDTAPLDSLQALADRYRGWCIVDESHAFGVLGRGRGTAHEFGVQNSRVIYGGSSSKGFAAYGGLIAGPAEVIQRMRTCDAAIGTNPGLSAAAAMTAASLAFLSEHPEFNEKLRANIERLYADLEKEGYDCAGRRASGIAFHDGDLAFKREVQAKLAAKGYFVGVFVYQGSGPEGVLRITVTAGHTFDEIDGVVREFVKYVPAERG
ncbi:MAG: pyridoxal phosphate-dependent aminotransferase family protein [Clostridia bacterium]|nr:pyridoxal phosphate-dependent aminotransferase family protein [Clostridia bacterium]